MKKQFAPGFLDDYLVFMHRVALRIYERGQQRECASALGLDPTYLNKVLRGVVRPSSLVFLQILAYAGIDIFKMTMGKSVEF